MKDISNKNMNDRQPSNKSNSIIAGLGAGIGAFAGSVLGGKTGHPIIGAGIGAALGSWLCLQIYNAVNYRNKR